MVIPTQDELMKEFDSVDIKAFRDLKRSPVIPQKSEKSMIPVSTNSTEVSSIVKTALKPSIDPILKAWSQTEPVAQKTSKTRPGPLSLRLNPEDQKRLDLVEGKGLGSKISSILKLHETSQLVFKDQAEKLIRRITQLDQELDSYTSTPGSIGDLGKSDGQKIRTMASELFTIQSVLSFSHEHHGKFLSRDQLRTLNFAINLHRNY